MQQKGKSGCPFNLRADGRALEAKDQIAFPVPWNGAILNLGRTFADHDLIRDKWSSFALSTRPRHAQSPSRTQSSNKFTAQRTTSLNEQGLINGFRAYARCVIFRKVQGQSSSNLFW